MLHYDELKQAVNGGYIKGDEVSVVRKDGKIFDYVLPNELVRPWEVVTVESLSEVLSELSESE